MYRTFIGAILNIWSIIPAPPSSNPSKITLFHPAQRVSILHACNKQIFQASTKRELLSALLGSIGVAIGEELEGALLGLQDEAINPENGEGRLRGRCPWEFGSNKKLDIPWGPLFVVARLLPTHVLAYNLFWAIAKERHINCCSSSREKALANPCVCARTIKRHDSTDSPNVYKATDSPRSGHGILAFFGLCGQW